MSFGIESNDVSTNDVSLNDIFTTDLSNNIEFLLHYFIINKIKDLSFNENIKLDTNSINVINLILNKHPKLIKDIEPHIKNIIFDNVVSAKDIPEILLLITDVLNTNALQLNKLKLTRDQVINFVKNVFIILIETNVIKTSDQDKVLVLSLLEVSIKLLETKVNVQKVINCHLF